MAMRDPYLDALEQLEQMRDRAFEAEAAIQRVRDVPKKVAVARRGDVDNPQKLAWYQGWNEAIDAVFRALDGGAE